MNAEHVNKCKEELKTASLCHLCGIGKSPRSAMIHAVHALGQVLNPLPCNYCSITIKRIR